MRTVPASDLTPSDVLTATGCRVVRVIRAALKLPAGKCWVVLRSRNGVERCACWNKRTAIQVY